MIEIVLLLVIVVQTVLLGWFEHNARKERKSLVNALMAKDSQELLNLELADKTKIAVTPEEKPDLTETSSLSDEEYEKVITNG